ncbi:MAG: hemerythrin domain-containing protein [Pyrinomonadaceae bacterium]|nr:hemerythrin domain-containing protein [Pyrinomonadaceae bacterium]
MNITELLTEDHRDAESLITQLEGGGDRETFTKLKNALILHTQIEEDIYYSALEDFEETEEFIEEARQEHNDIENTLDEMGSTEIPSDEFQELLFQLKESVEEHINEEENQLFPLSESLLGIETLEEMGEKAEQMKSKTESKQLQKFF